MSRAGEFSCPLHAAAVFVAHVNADAALRMASSCDAHLQLLNEIANSPAVQRFADMVDLHSVLAAADEADSLPPVAHVSTPNGAAHVVEFAPQCTRPATPCAGVRLRPVAWFSFFTRQQRDEWAAAHSGEGAEGSDSEEEEEEGVVNIFHHARRQSTKQRHTYAGKRAYACVSLNMFGVLPGFVRHCSTHTLATCWS